MNTADFTLFEVHLHDSLEFSPTNSAPLLSKGVDVLTDADDESHGDCDAEFGVEFDADEGDEFDKANDAESDGRPGLRLLVELVLLVGVTTAVRYIRDGDGDFDELTDIDDTGDEEHDRIEVDA